MRPIILNPILRGFNPDPSFCRVGEDIYLATSSFEYAPKTTAGQAINA